MTTIVTRAEWGARPATSALLPLKTPTPELWLHHTAGNEHGHTGMRAIQAAHQAKGWVDVGYSFVVDPFSGTVFEGRGAGVIGAHTEGHNSIAHGICVMGNYETTPVTDALIHTIADLVAYGHRQGWWPDHLTGGHRDTKATACPGRHLYAAIRRINSEAEAILANDTPNEGDPMAAPDVEAAQRMINAWLVPEDHLEPDGDWGPASTAALKKILDDTADYIEKIRQSLADTGRAYDAAERRAKELQVALTNTTPPATDADRTLTELRAVLRKVVG